MGLSDSELRKVQEIQLEILLELDRICREYNIKYQLFAGTLLGAIRHKGFIPWDDDIDVCMLRKDYEKFIEIGKKSLSTRYYLQHNEIDKQYFHQFLKIRRKNTLLLQDISSELDMNHGICIDVFPMDNVITNTILGKLHLRTCNILRKLSYLRLKNKCMQIRSPIKRNLVLIGHYIVKIIPKTWIDKLELTLIKLFQNKDTQYVASVAEGASDSRINRTLQERKAFYDLIEGEFENNRFPIPKHFDEILRRIYGDYMKLPPLEQRKSHHGILKVVFNTNKDQMS